MRFVYHTKMSTFLDRLKQAMKESGATKTDLWKACDISSGAVSQWFSKPTTQLKGKNLLCVARVLGVSPIWLETGEGNKSPEAEEADKPAGKGVPEVSLSFKQKRVLELMNKLGNEDLKSWLKYAETMARDDSQKNNAHNTVNTGQTQPIESLSTDRRNEPNLGPRARAAGYGMGETVRRGELLPKDYSTKKRRKDGNAI